MSAFLNGTDPNQTRNDLNIPNCISPTESIGSLPDFDSLTYSAFNDMFCTFAQTGNYLAIELMKSKRTVDVKVINRAILTALRCNQLRIAAEIMRDDVSAEVRGWFIVYAAENNRLDYIQRYLPRLSMIQPDFLESAQKKASEKDYWVIYEYLTGGKSPSPPSHCCIIQ